MVFPPKLALSRVDTILSQDFLPSWSAYTEFINIISGLAPLSIPRSIIRIVRRRGNSDAFSEWAFLTCLKVATGFRKILPTLPPRNQLTIRSIKLRGQCGRWYPRVDYTKTPMKRLRPCHLLKLKVYTFPVLVKVIAVFELVEFGYYTCQLSIVMPQLLFNQSQCRSPSVPSQRAGNKAFKISLTWSNFVRR